jgi:hypothetical protein
MFISLRCCGYVVCVNASLLSKEETLLDASHWEAAILVWGWDCLSHMARAFRLAIDNVDAQPWNGPFTSKTDAHSRHQCKHGICCCCGPRIATHQSNVASPLCALTDASCLTYGKINSPARDWNADRQSCVPSDKFQDPGADTMQDYCKSRIHYPVRTSIRLVA